ncbi:MAG: PTS sugar transporter subunit IIA [Solobacterium sp.]|nr:PTS sugar transporter subunit IIA [Solobacterium sp.]
MIGIILASHGPLAEGLLHTSEWFFQDQKQLEALCLTPDTSPEMFTERLQDAIGRVDSGDGVLVLCDLLYGSPCSCAAQLLSENVEMITGMNLGILLELLGSRENAAPDISALVETGRNGVVNFKELLGTQTSETEEEDFF